MIVFDYSVKNPPDLVYIHRHANHRSKIENRTRTVHPNSHFTMVNSGYKLNVVYADRNHSFLRGGGGGGGVDFLKIISEKYCMTLLILP